MVTNRVVQGVKLEPNRDWPEISNWESSLKINSFHCGPVLSTFLPWGQCSAGQCVMVSMRLSVWSEFGICFTFSGYLCKCSPRGADEGLHVPVSCLSQLAGEILIHRQTWSYHSRTGNAHESQVVLTFLWYCFFLCSSLPTINSLKKWHIHVFCECVPMLMVTLFSVLSLNVKTGNAFSIITSTLHFSFFPWSCFSVRDVFPQTVCCSNTLNWLFPNAGLANLQFALKASDCWFAEGLLTYLFLSLEVSGAGWTGLLTQYYIFNLIKNSDMQEDSKYGIFVVFARFTCATLERLWSRWCTASYNIYGLLLLDERRCWKYHGNKHMGRQTQSFFKARSQGKIHKWIFFVFFHILKKKSWNNCYGMDVLWKGWSWCNSLTIIDSRLCESAVRHTTKTSGLSSKDHQAVLHSGVLHFLFPV